MPAEEFDPSANDSRLLRRKNAATALGVEFEMKVAGLIALRAMDSNIDFKVFANVNGLGVLDDVVVRLLGDPPVTVFMQLKHSRHPMATLGRQRLLSREGKLSILTFFQSYEKIMEMQDTQGSLTEVQRFVEEALKGDYYFILYTNMAINDCPLQADEMSFKDLLATTRNGEQGVLSFNLEDHELRKLVDDEVDVERRGAFEEFLRRMRVFSYQSDADTMDDHLRSMIRSMYCGSADVFLTRYLGSLKLWAQNPKHNFCLNPSLLRPELSKCLAHELRCGAPTAFEGTLLHFESQALEILRRHVRSSKELKRPLHLLIPGAHVPGRRAMKILQALREEWGEECWTYVDGAALRRFSLDALEDAVRTALVLVTDAEGKDKHQMCNLTARLRNSVAEVALTAEAARTCIFQDEWNLSQLSEESQRIVLGKSVTFQGKSVLLRDLEEIWPLLYEQINAETLLALEEGREVVIGTTLPVVEGVFERRLEHNSLVMKEALTQVVVARGKGLLALGGFPQKLLQNAARALRLQDPNDNERWITLTSADSTDRGALESMASRKGVQSLHHLEYVSGDSLDDLVMLWRYSVGNAEEIKDFVKVATEVCSKESVCKHNSSSSISSILKLPTVLIVGAAGAGKTTQMEAVAAKFKEQRPSKWVILVKILEQSHLLRSWQEEELCEKHAVELLAEAAGATSRAARLCLEAALTCVNAVSVFVDGVDEVAPAFTTHVLDLLRLIQKVTKEGTLWVASRPEVETSLRRALKSPPMRLQPLTEDEQRLFLQARWASQSIRGPQQEVEEEINSRVEAARNWLAREADGLLATTLHLQMVADIFSPYSSDASRGTSEEGNLSLLQLYRLFIDRKKQLYINRYLPNITGENLSFQDDFLRRHQLCAIWFLLRDDASAKDLPLEEARNCVELLKNDIGAKEKWGILWVDEHRALHFLHHSYAEFFCAQWLFSNALASTGARAFVLRGLPATGRLRTFLEEMLQEKWPLHAAAWRRDLQKLEELLTAGSLGAGAFAKRDSFLGRSVGQYLEWAFEHESMSPLHTAASLGLLVTMEALLNNAGDVNARTTFQRTPLHCAMGGQEWPYDTPHRHDAAQWLIRRQGVHIDAKDSEGWTPLSLAAAANCKRCEKTLVKAGASTSCAPTSVHLLTIPTASTSSISSRDLSEILAKVDSVMNRSRESSPLAKEVNNLEMLELVPERVSPIQHTNSNNVELISKGKEGDSDLGGGRNEERRNLYEGMSKIKRQMYNKNHGKRYEMQEQQRWIRDEETRLCQQIQELKSTNQSLASTLMSAPTFVADSIPTEGAISSSIQDIKFSPAHITTSALTPTNGRTPPPIPKLNNVVNSTLNSTSNKILNSEPTQDKSSTPNPISTSGEISQNLLNSVKEGNLAKARHLLRVGASSDVADSNGDSPLHLACCKGHVDMASALVEAGADVSRPGFGGRSPLHYAALCGSTECIELLLQHGASPNQREENGETPLHFAAYSGHVASAELLLRHGAYKRASNFKGELPRDLARPGRMRELLDFL